jgi:homoserine kinase
MAGEMISRRAIAPASSANLGPGFDALAVALAIHVEVTVSPAPELEVVTAGEGADLTTGPEHLAAKVVRSVLGHDRVRIEVSSAIPVARGLGSSAALAAAAAAAAGADDPFAVAAEVDGHGENAAASVFGGLAAATRLADGGFACSRLPLDPSLAFVLVVPERPLSTAEARAALPGEVTLTDAAANLGRSALLIGALGDRQLFRPGLMDDRLHQPYRSPLFPEAVDLIDLLTGCGALGAAWSGAGPSVIGVVERDRGAEILEEVRRGLASVGKGTFAGYARVVDADMRGLLVAEVQP